MSNRRLDGDGHDATRSGPMRMVEIASVPSPVSARTGAGLLALLPTVAVTLYRVVLNTPGGLPGGLPTFASGTLSALVVAPALAALALAATVDATTERVGLAFVGGFGLLSVASSAAWLPAAVGVAGGCGLVVGARVTRLDRTQPTDFPTAGVGIVVTAAVATSLAATAGVQAPTLRPLGSWLALLGVAATPLLVGVDRPGVLVGGVAGVLTLAVGSSVPYVTGAVLLVGGGVVGVPLGLVALAVGGGVAALGAAFRGRDTDALLGVALLLVAGVPGTLFRAVAVAVAVALLVASVDADATPGSRTSSGGASA